MAEQNTGYWEQWMVPALLGVALVSVVAAAYFMGVRDAVAYWWVKAGAMLLAAVVCVGTVFWRGRT